MSETDEIIELTESERLIVDLDFSLFITSLSLSVVKLSEIDYNNYK